MTAFYFLSRNNSQHSFADGILTPFFFLRKKNLRVEMRHDVLVYLSYFYEKNIKDHDRVWRTKVVFWNFLKTIYEIFDFSETVVFS